MVDERDEQYDGEEGEYHFSDDQVNYEADNTETSKIADSAAPSMPLKDRLLAKFTQHRRVIIGSVVFLVLIGVIYKMLIPSSSVPSTEIAQATTPPVHVATASQAQLKQAAPVNQPAPPTAQPATTLQQVPQQSTMPSPTAMAAAATAQPAGSETMPPQGMPSQAVAQQMPPQPGTPEQPMSPMQQAQAAMMPQGSMPQQQPIPPQPPVTEAQSKSVTERLATLEQQNAAVMNLLQTEYAQKISDYETQSTSARGKMEEVTKRLNRMEATLNQITQILSGRAAGGVEAMPQTVMMNPPASPKMAEKMTYAVQAIIPGRAWLKSDAGDTVTVAEGDVLRGYGRITKIDPYDGIVNIDTGNKVITLSYGMSAE